MLLRLACSYLPPKKRHARALLDRDDELSKRAHRRPKNCTERALYSSKRSIERLMVRVKIQHRLLMRAIADLEREREEINSRDEKDLSDNDRREAKRVITHDVIRILEDSQEFIDM